MLSAWPGQLERVRLFLNIDRVAVLALFAGTVQACGRHHVLVRPQGLVWRGFGNWLSYRVTTLLLGQQLLVCQLLLLH